MMVPSALTISKSKLILDIYINIILEYDNKIHVQVTLLRQNEEHIDFAVLSEELVLKKLVQKDLDVNP